MLDVISDGRLNLGAGARRHRAGDGAVWRRSGVHRRTVEGDAEVHRPLLAEETIEWESELLKIHPPPGRPAHGGAAAGADAAPAALPRLHQPRDREAGGRSTGSGRWFSVSEVPRRSARCVACSTRSERPAIPTNACRPGTSTTNSSLFVPSFLLDDREEALRIGARALRFFAEAITHWAAPNGVAPARGTDKVDNVAFMKEHLERPMPRSLVVTHRPAPRHCCTASTTRSAMPTRPSTTYSGWPTPASTT